MVEITIEKGPSLSVNEVLKKLSDPIFNLSENNRKKLLIVCEDNTRITPIHLFFRELVKILTDRNIEITLLFALGTHRPMTKLEIQKKLGLSENEVDNLKIVNHNAEDEEGLVFVAEVEGVPLKINKLVQESDIVITLSSVIPHRVMGFSGGGKMLCPGIGNKQFIDYSHYRSTLYPESEVMGVKMNPQRQLMDKQVDLVEQAFPKVTFLGASFVVIDENIIDVFVNNLKDSYWKAANLSESIFVKEVPRVNSILALVDNQCTDFWQAAKAVYNCARALNPGGKIVVKGEMVDGISASHESDITITGYQSPAILNEAMKNGVLTNKVAVSHMIRVGEYVEKFNIYLASPNISLEKCKLANLGYVDEKDIIWENFDLVVHHPTEILLKPIQGDN